MHMASGKWAVAGVPHKGWSCIDTEDLGEPLETCEMCESHSIRYVHVMAHPDYPGELRCGCVCAGNMEQDSAAAYERETTMKNAVRRRLAWPLRKAWRRSPNGNLHIKAKGYRITVFQKGSTWGAVISRPAPGLKKFARRVYASAEAAQLATFDALLFLQGKH